MPRKSVRGPHETNTTLLEYSKRVREPRNVHYSLTISPLDLDELQKCADKAGIELTEMVRWCVWQGLHLAKQEQESWNKGG